MRRYPKKGLTRPLPDKAISIAEMLRREVPRPNYLPIGNPLRFDRVLISNDLGWPCPMGLHPAAKGRDEPCMIPFGKAGEAFSEWWDEQEDAEAATNAVWG